MKTIKMIGDKENQLKGLSILIYQDTKYQFLGEGWYGVTDEAFKKLKKAKVKLEVLKWKKRK